VVCIVKTNLKTHAQAHVILFSSDLALNADKAVKLVALSGRSVATRDEARALLWPRGGGNFDA